MARIIAGEMHQLEFYSPNNDDPIDDVNELTVIIRNADFHNFSCELSPAFDLEPNNGGGKTKLDIDLLQFGGDPKHTIVTIVIDNPDITFIPDKYENGVLTRMAITAGDGIGVDDMRNLAPKYQNGNGPNKTVSFVVFRTNEGDKKPHPFNIGLLVRDGDFEMPVILDPKVRNDGG